MLAGSLNVSSNQVVADFSRKLGMQIDPAPYGKIYTDVCGEGAQASQQADSRFAKSLDNFLRDVKATPMPPSYRLFLKGGERCPESSPANVRYRELDAVYTAITFSLLSQENFSTVSKIERLVMDAVSRHSRFWYNETEKPDLNFKRLVDIYALLREPSKFYRALIDFMGSQKGPREPRLLEWEKKLMQHETFNGSMSDYLRIASSDHLKDNLALSTWLLLKYGENTIVSRVFVLQASLLSGNKTMEAWVHMVANLASGQKLFNARRWLAEMSLDFMEGAIRVIREDVKKSKYLPEGYAESIIKSMERHIRIYSAPLLDIQKQEALNRAGSPKEYEDLVDFNFSDDGESGGTTGTPNSSTPQFNSPAASASGTSLSSKAIGAGVLSGHTLLRSSGNVMHSFGARAQLAGAQMMTQPAAITPLSIAHHFYAFPPAIPVIPQLVPW